MAPSVPHQANDFPGDPFLHSIQQQPHNRALQNGWVPPAPANGQPEGHRKDIPPPVRNVAGPQDPHHFDLAYQGVIDYHPQLLNPGYVFPDVGLAQGIPAQAQPNGAPVNPEPNPFGFGYVPQHAPDLVQAGFPHPFVHHRVATPNPAGAENLR